MFDKEAYWLNRKSGLRGQPDLPEPILIEGSGKAPLMDIQGTKVYIPRRQRRLIMRKFRTDLRKGRINMEDIIRKKAELAHDRAE